MTSDYDSIAGQYQRAKQHPWRLAVEAYTLESLVGDVRGKSVVDLACGEGFYTRRLRKAGADPVLGVDLSAAMIALAREQEAREPIGVTYDIQDGRALGFERQFDLAVAAYLLNYARDRTELLAMTRGIARSLRPGGRFVTVNMNPNPDEAPLPSFRRYGFDTTLSHGLREGDTVLYTFYLDDGPVSVENYFLSKSTYASALAEAGFRKVTWHSCRLEASAAAAHEPGYWSLLLDHPPIVFLECET